MSAIESYRLRILVTSGESRQAVAATRSLGSLGNCVIVGAARQPSLAAVSRHCAGRFVYPNPDAEPAAFVDAIIEVAERERIGLLMPMTEVTTWLLAEHRQRLPPKCALVMPSKESLSIANDKSRVLALAGELGVPVPSTHRIDSPGEAATASTLRYPIVIKPARSRVLTASGWLSTRVDYAVDSRELARKLDRLSPDVYPVLLQERIVGPGLGVSACYQDGRPVAYFSHRRLREKPPSGGVSVLCESVALDREALNHAQRLLTELRWHGVAMVEFKRDGRDGSLRLMEINGRFWGSLQLAIDAGVNFPALVSRIAAGEYVEPVRKYDIGVRLRWFIGDFDAMLAIMARSPARIHLPHGHSSRWETLRAVLNPWRRNQRNELLRMDDPRPGLLEIRRWLAGG